MNVLEILLAAGGFGGLAWVGTYAAQSLHDRFYDRYWQWKARAQNHRAYEQDIRLKSIRLLQPDANGRQGIAYDGRVYRDLDSRAAFTQEMNLFFDPMMERLNSIHKALVAIQAGGKTALPQQVEGMIDQTQPWPATVSLLDLFTDRQPSINDLVIGARPAAQGLDVVSLPLHQLMHTLTVGASGWGKSTWLRSFLWQIDKAPEPCDVVAIDINGSEFNTLHGWSKLRYPVARTTRAAIAVLQAVGAEIEQRKIWYEDTPTAATLVEYNRLTGKTVPPVLVVIDEGTNLLNQDGIGEPLRTTVQTARQYGVYVLLSGQSAKASVIDTQIRDNFSSRLCFRVPKGSSRAVLEDSAASDLDRKGRMIAQLVGREQAELQGPFVSKAEFLRTLTHGEPAEPTPEPDTTEAAAQATGATPEQVEQVRELWAHGVAVSAIAEQVFGARGGAAFYRTKEILDEWDTG